METIGDHIRKRRLDLKMLQRDVAERIGVDVTSIVNWEKQRSEPETRFLPAIIEFLGYNPLPEAADLAGALRLKRRSLGLSQEQLAKRIGVDESTIAHWEQGSHRPTGLYRRLLENFVCDAD